MKNEEIRTTKIFMCEDILGYHRILEKALNELKEHEFIGAKFSQLVYEKYKEKIKEFDAKLLSLKDEIINLLRQQKEIEELKNKYGVD